MNYLVSRLKTRHAQCQLAVAAAYQEIARQEKIAKKDKTVIPPFQMERLVAEVTYCKNEMYSVEASIAGASKYPPIARAKELN